MAATKSRDALITSVIPLVRKIAKQVGRHLPVEIDELISDGHIGAIKAADDFDPERGVQFSTYAAHRIRGAMLDGVRERDHLSRAMRQAAAEDDSRWLVPISLDTPIGEDGHSTVGDLIADPEDRFQRICDIECARWALRQVGDDRQRQVIVWHYWDDVVLWKIGEILGVTESRACQLETDALDIMRVACIRAGLGIDVADATVRNAIKKHRGNRAGERELLYKDLADVWGIG